MLYVTGKGVQMAIASLVTMLAVGVWVTRGGRKYTEEGEQQLVAVFATGILITVVIVLIDAMSIMLP